MMRMFSLLATTGAAALLACSASAASAADLFFYFKYSAPLSLRGITFQDGSVIQDTAVGSQYNGPYVLWNNQALSSDISGAFNIVDSAGHLLHTYTYSGTAGSTDFDLSFLSSEVGPLTSVAGPNIVANGSIQNVGSFTAGNDSYTMAFQTTLTGAVPEPATWAMLILGFGVVGGAMRRRQRVSVRFA